MARVTVCVVKSYFYACACGWESVAFIVGTNRGAAEQHDEHRQDCPHDRILTRGPGQVLVSMVNGR